MEWRTRIDVSTRGQGLVRSRNGGLNWIWKLRIRTDLGMEARDRSEKRMGQIQRGLGQTWKQDHN